MNRCNANHTSRRSRARWILVPLALFASLLLLAPPAQAQGSGNANANVCAVTPGGWGAPPEGDNNGALLHANFDAVFGVSLVVGDLLFEDAQDVTDTIPFEGPGSAFQNHAVALAINIAFGEAGLLPGSLGDVEVPDGSHAGFTAIEILALAEIVLLDTEDDEELQGHVLIDIMASFNEGANGCGDAPECPDDLTAIAQSDGSVLLSWASVDGAVEYAIYRGADGGPLVALDTTAQTTYHDETTAVGSVYTYRVTAFDGELESELCVTVTVTAVPFFGAPLLAALAVGGSVAAFRAMKRKP